MNKKSLAKSQSQALTNWGPKDSFEELPKAQRHYWEERRDTEIRKAQEQTLRRIPKALRTKVVRALVGLRDPGEEDPAPLCQALKKYGPALLLDPLILECLRILWIHAPSDKSMRDDLQKICSALAYAPHRRGRKPRLSERSKAITKRFKSPRSQALTTWRNKFKRLLERFPDNPNWAADLTLLEFDEKSQIPNHGLKTWVRKDLEQEFREIIERVKPELREN